MRQLRTAAVLLLALTGSLKSLLKMSSVKGKGRFALSLQAAFFSSLLLNVYSARSATTGSTRVARRPGT
jgi:hypothetical protein